MYVLYFGGTFEFCNVSDQNVLYSCITEWKEEAAEVKDLLNELCYLKHWFWFGANLGVPPARLHQIGAESGNIQDYIQKVIVEWCKLEIPKWSKVVQALTKMGYKCEAEMLATKYG